MIRIPVPLEEFSALPRDEQGKVNTALTASCVLNNGKRLQWLGRVTAVDAALDSKSNSAVLIASPGAECLPCLRVASGSRQHGSSSSHQRSSSRFCVDSRFRRQGRQLHPGKNAVRNAGTQGAGSGVKRRQSPGDRSGIPVRGRSDSLIHFFKGISFPTHFSAAGNHSFQKFPVGGTTRPQTGTRYGRKGKYGIGKAREFWNAERVGVF